MKQEFYDRYPRFLETTETIPSRSRLNGRWRAIIEWNKAIFVGRRVLDLGCHDGRWSFAALEAGASHVIGIEGRAHLAKKAAENFNFYGVTKDSYSFMTGDAVAALRGMEAGKIDVLMCLGFFYHTMEHMRLLLEARRIGAQYVIVDTGVSRVESPIIALSFEPVADTRNSIDYGGTGNEMILVGMPSKSGLIAMLKYSGYDAEFFDWPSSVVDWTDLQDYEESSRVTVRAKARW